MICARGMLLMKKRELLHLILLFINKGVSQVVAIAISMARDVLKIQIGELRNFLVNFLPQVRVGKCFPIRLSPAPFFPFFDPSSPIGSVNEAFANIFWSKK